VDKDGLPHGITVSSFTSVSLSPPLVLVCIDHRSPLLQHLAAGTHFGVNVLASHQQRLSGKFARDYENRFAGVEWYVGKTGVPLLFETPANFECETVLALPAGDHAILLGKVLHANSEYHPPLIYVNRGYGTTIESQAI
jgi:flavin reductase (DIM6/NTAB) family NADH-FMN oxidoreductase RutF